MRIILFLLLAAPSLAHAQPGPPTFCFVLAEGSTTLRPLARAVQVEQHYRERAPAPGPIASWLKTEVVLRMEHGTLFGDTTGTWHVYHPYEHGAEAYVLILAGADTMRLDMPEDPMPLRQQELSRSARDTPEVIRFRAGRYAMEEYILERRNSGAAKRLSTRMFRNESAAYIRMTEERGQRAFGKAG
ncbi:MAG: hypothetical protein ABI432_08960 [Flavobacteriales bacterium]